MVSMRTLAVRLFRMFPCRPHWKNTRTLLDSPRWRWDRSWDRSQAVPAESPGSFLGKKRNQKCDSPKGGWDRSWDRSQVGKCFAIAWRRHARGLLQPFRSTCFVKCCLIMATTRRESSKNMPAIGCTSQVIPSSFYSFLSALYFQRDMLLSTVAKVQTTCQQSGARAK